MYTHLNGLLFYLETYTKHNVDVLRVVGIPLFGIPPFKGDIISRYLSWCMRSIKSPKSITDFKIIDYFFYVDVPFYHFFEWP